MPKIEEICGEKAHANTRKFKRKLSEVNTRAVSRRQNELVGKFKMAAGNMLILGGRLWRTCTFQQESKGSCIFVAALSSLICFSKNQYHLIDKFMLQVAV